MKKKNLLTAIFIVLISSLWMTACTKETKEVDLNEVYAKIEETKKVPKVATVDDTVLFNSYGIESKNCKQNLLKVSIEATLSDEIILIEAKDSKNADSIEEKLNQRLKYKAEEAEGYLPDQYAIIMESRVKRNGNYICLIISPDAKEFLDIYDSFFK